MLVVNVYHLCSPTYPILSEYAGSFTPNDVAGVNVVVVVVVVVDVVPISPYLTNWFEVYATLPPKKFCIVNCKGSSKAL